MSKLKSVSVEINIPLIGKIGGVWEPNNKEQQAAWEMYVELITRVAVVEIGNEEGLLREALTSLYNLFGITRKILCQYGPSIAISKNGSQISFGYLSIAILNTVLRPVLAKWHPLLAHYESMRSPSTSSVEHEQVWTKSQELRQTLAQTRIILAEYANLLAQVAGVPSLTVFLGEDS